MNPCERLLFGTPGIPRSAVPHDSVSACRRIAELGLDAMELEYVRGSFPGEERCRAVRAAAHDHGIRLTAHGPYYINLNAHDEEKREASRHRIRNTAHYGGLSGAESITFHAGFYLKDDPQLVLGRIVDELKSLADEIGALPFPVDLRPETTGKPSQFGSLEELLSIAEEVPVVRPCIDWAHLRARDDGMNTITGFQAVIDSIRTRLGEKTLRTMHMHLAGIAFGPKGERNHLNLEESDMNWRGLLQVLKDNDVRGILICESPSIEDDTRILKDYYDSL